MHQIERGLYERLPEHLDDFEASTDLNPVGFSDALSQDYAKIAARLEAVKNHPFYQADMTHEKAVAFLEGQMQGTVSSIRCEALSDGYQGHLPDHVLADHVCPTLPALLSSVWHFVEVRGHPCFKKLDSSGVESALAGSPPGTCIIRPASRMGAYTAVLVTRLGLAKFHLEPWEHGWTLLWETKQIRLATVEEVVAYLRKEALDHVAVVVSPSAIRPHSNSGISPAMSPDLRSQSPTPGGPGEVPFGKSSSLDGTATRLPGRPWAKSASLDALPLPALPLIRDLTSESWFFDDEDDSRIDGAAPWSFFVRRSHAPGVLTVVYVTSEGVRQKSRLLPLKDGPSSESLPAGSYKWEPTDEILSSVRQFVQWIQATGMLRTPLGRRVRANHPLFDGVLLFYGVVQTAQGPKIRAGIRLDEPRGTDGLDEGGVRHFDCPPGYGLYATPYLVSLLPQ